MHDLKLEFNCPVDIKGMPKCDGGYACQECKKPVFDYSKMNLKDFESSAKKNAVISQCGIYKAYQIDGVYGDWRDKVTKSYRSSIRKANTKKRYLVLLPFMVGFLFMIGCANRHVCGGDVSADGWGINDSPVKDSTATSPSGKVNE
jgi:hypothetical protein